MATRAAKVKRAALIRPRVSLGETKLRRAVAIVPMKTEVLSHFYK